jgi:hypothetical protein
MSTKTPAEKAHVRPGTKIALLNSVPGVVESLGLPPDVSFVEPPDADLVFVFVCERAELETLLEPATRTLRVGATLWAFFRKGSAEAGLDMSRNDVWAVADAAGLRPLGLVSVDDVWTVFRLKRPSP